MSRKVLLLDLDRTLLDTNKFLQAFWQAMAHAYGVDAEHEMAMVPEWYHAIGEYRYYDLKMHLEQGLGKNAEEVVETLRPQLQGQDFLYPDVQEMAKWQEHKEYEIRVVTFGPQWVQLLKLQFTPSLAHLPSDIMLESKSAYIARNFADATGFLVDDKRNSHMPNNIKQLWLVRDKSVQDMLDKETVIIHSLTQVEEAL